MSSPRRDITQLLVEWSDGDETALAELTPLVYGELHRMAHRYMHDERSDHTLQTTGLVNEAFLRLVNQHHVHWQSRAHFYAVAAQLMRRVLVDYARAHQAAKRGGAEIKVTFDEADEVSYERAAELIRLDEALTNLATVDSQKCRIVELRFFGGLTIDEVAEVTGVSVPTVVRQWRMARAWLQCAMRAGEPA